MRFLRRSLTGLFLLATTLALLAYAGHTFKSAIEARNAREARAIPARERVFAARVLRIAPQDITPTLTAFGEVRSRRTLDLRAKAAGSVVELADSVVEGGAVQAGALLLRVDPADARAALDVARNDLADARADQRDAELSLSLTQDQVAAAENQAALRRKALARQQDLRQRGVGTDAAVETAELAAAAAEQAVVSTRQSLANARYRAEQAETGLARARIALSEAERDLADTELRAAFAGVLSDVSIVQGALVANNEQIARLIDPAALEVSFRVSTAQYARLRDADGRLDAAPVRAVLDVLGADLVATGVITRESGAVGEGQTGRLLFARLDDADGFRPGDFVTIQVREPLLRDVVRVPARAVDAAGIVLVVGADNRLEEAPVEVLRREGDQVIIRADALKGRDIVAERGPLLGAGILIRPLRPDQDDPGPSDAATLDTDLMELTPERRAQLIDFVKASPQIPPEDKDRVLSQLAKDRVPTQMIQRLESRMGG